MPEVSIIDRFREELGMLREASFIEEWIREAEIGAEARGEARAEARAEARGEVREARRALLHLFRSRFGEPESALRTRIETADTEWCHGAFDRLLAGASPEELNS